MSRIAEILVAEGYADSEDQVEVCDNGEAFIRHDGAYSYKLDQEQVHLICSLTDF